MLWVCGLPQSSIINNDTVSWWKKCLVLQLRYAVVYTIWTDETPFSKMKDYLYQIGVIFISVNSVDSFCLCVCAGFVRWGWESSVMNCRMDYQNGSCGSSNLKQLEQNVTRKKVLMWCSEVFIQHIQQILPPKINIEPESIFETGSNRF